MIPDKDVIAKLEKSTNFTTKEITEFFSYTDTPEISKADFDKILEKSGIKNPVLQARMWDTFDVDNDSNVSLLEIIQNLNVLLRGEIHDVTKFFFNIYDINHDREIDLDEILVVYGSILKDVSNTDITDAQIEKIKGFIKSADTNKNGTLDFEEFDKAVVQAMEKAPKKDGGKWAFWGLFLLTALFEMGTSFGLPSMGALSQEMKDRFKTTDTGIGFLTGLYYAAACIGPLAGGMIIDSKGPTMALFFANLFVAAGVFMQATVSTFGGLVWARVILGLGGEVTAFATIEILDILFPDDFMLMCGVRNFVQSASGFLAFWWLPMWATISTDFALWMIFFIAVLALAATCVAWVIIKKKKETSAKKISASKVFKAFGTKMVPKAPGKFADWKLPAAFFIAIYGIKSFYIPPFSFTAFSKTIFTNSRYNLSEKRAGFLSGFISLIAGGLGPICGPLSDKLGKRAESFIVAVLPSVLAFALFAMFDGEAVVWTGIVLLAITYGYGDTCAFVSIRLIVGEKRAGVGYAVYAIIGNLLSFLIPIFGGLIMDTSDELDPTDTAGHTWTLWYFAILMLLSTISWWFVRKLEGPKSTLALPADELIETSDDAVNAATLMTVVENQV